MTLNGADVLDARAGPVCGARYPSRAQLRRAIATLYPASAARDHAPRPRREVAPPFAAAVSGATDEIGYLSVGASAGNLFFQLVNAPSPCRPRGQAARTDPLSLSRSAAHHLFPAAIARATLNSACRCARQPLGGLHLRAAAFPLPGLVAPVAVVPSAVPLPVPALGVIPDE